MKISAAAVFCGSKNGTDPVFVQHAAELGKLLAANNIKLIYGGGRNGIMGAIADGVMNNGGHVIGVIPEVILEWETQNKNITELIVVDNMHTRKKKLYELCDIAVILPGGFGTLDELFEMLTWNQLSIHNKNIYLLNTNGFYNALIEHIYRLEKNEFLYEPVSTRINIINEPGELVKLLQLK
jgi:uncharacterized protein (TIGR00730 family)